MNYSVDTVYKHRANLEYQIFTGDPYKIGIKSTKIETAVLDSIYDQSKSRSWIKKGAQFDISNFDKERQRVTVNVQNSGIYHFNQNSFSLENDTIEKDH